jgi:hypothetical protein
MQRILMRSMRRIWGRAVFIESSRQFHFNQNLASQRTNLKLERKTLIDTRRRYFRQTKKPNHYETLGISEDATPSQIKSAYYRLAQTYHPDKNYGRVYYVMNCIRSFFTEI